MKLHTRLSAALALLLSSLVISGTVAGSAHAAYNPCSTGGAAAGVARTAGPSAEGVSAVMPYRPIALCTTDLSDSNYVEADVLVEGAGGNDGYSFSGFTYYSSLGCARHLAGQVQYANGSPTLVYGSCVPANQVHQVWSTYDPGTAKELAEIDASVFIRSSFNPVTSWTAPWKVELYGYANYQSSDVPGTAAAKETHSNILYQNYYGGAWVNDSFTQSTYTSLNNSYRYSTVRASANEIDYWTSNPSGII